MSFGIRLIIRSMNLIFCGVTLLDVSMKVKPLAGSITVMIADESRKLRTNMTINRITVFSTSPSVFRADWYTETLMEVKMTGRIMYLRKVR